MMNKTEILQNNLDSKTGEFSRALGLIQRVNLFFGLIGGLFLLQLSNFGALKSFLFGWAFSLVNTELMKRICGLLIVLFQDGQTARVSPMIYFFLFVKLSIWGIVLSVLLNGAWIQPYSFVLGSVSIIISALFYGIREMTYARTT